MNARTVAAAVLVVLLLALAPSLQAGGHEYQFTGVVKSVDGKTFSVEKNPKTIWVFSIDASTKGVPKVGDKVTVYYSMTAVEIEVKAPAGTKSTKKK